MIVLWSAIIAGYEADSEAVDYIAQVKHDYVAKNTLGGMLLKENHQRQVTFKIVTI